MNISTIAQPDSDLSVDRRRFFINVISGLLSTIAGALGITSGMYLFRPPQRSKNFTWIDAGNISALQPGLPVQVTFERNSVDGWKVDRKKDSAWLLNAGGKLTAFVPLCTHLGCAYQWKAKRDLFVCPCHGSVFSKTGQVVAGPASRPLDQYEIKREGQRVWLGPVLQSTTQPNEQPRA